MSSKSPIFPISDPLHFNDAQTDYFHQALSPSFSPVAVAPGITIFKALLSRLFLSLSRSCRRPADAHGDAHV